MSEQDVSYIAVDSSIERQDATSDNDTLPQVRQSPVQADGNRVLLREPEIVYFTRK